VEDYLHNKEISNDTEMLSMTGLPVSPSAALRKVATSGSMVHREASYVWTMLCDTFGENTIIRTPEYYELTDNDCVKGLKRRCRGRSSVYSSNMLEANKRNSSCQLGSFPDWTLVNEQFLNTCRKMGLGTMILQKYTIQSFTSTFGPSWCALDMLKESAFYPQGQPYGTCSL
jgi:hypothetical protein